LRPKRVQKENPHDLRALEAHAEQLTLQQFPTRLAFLLRQLLKIASALQPSCQLSILGVADKKVLCDLRLEIIFVALVLVVLGHAVLKPSFLATGDEAVLDLQLLGNPHDLYGRPLLLDLLLKKVLESGQAADSSILAHSKVGNSALNRQQLSAQSFRRRLFARRRVEIVIVDPIRSVDSTAASASGGLRPEQRRAFLNRVFH